MTMPKKETDESYQDYCYRLQAHIRLIEMEVCEYRELFDTLDELRPLVNRLDMLRRINEAEDGSE